MTRNDDDLVIWDFIIMFKHLGILPNTCEWVGLHDDLRIYYDK